MAHILFPLPWQLGGIMYTVIHVCIGYTLRWRSLRNLHHQGLQAQGSVRSIETEPRCVIDLYHGLGVYAIAMYSNTIGSLGSLAAIARQCHWTAHHPSATTIVSILRILR